MNRGRQHPGAAIPDRLRAAVLMEIFLCVGLAVAIAANVYRAIFSETARIRRTFRAAPRVDIADAKPGTVVKIAGRIRPLGRPLRSALENRECVFFEATAEAHRGKSGRWVELIRETDAVDFLIEDGSGRAIVRSAGMRGLHVKYAERESGYLNDATPDLEAFLTRHGDRSPVRILSKTLRFKAGVFASGETVCVLGSVRWEQDPDPTQAGSGDRESPKRLVIEARPDCPLLVSHDPNLA